MLLPLQNVRGNFARIQSALNELLGLSERVSEPDDGGRQLDLGSIQLAIHDAVAMFQRQAQGLLQVCKEPLKNIKHDPVRLPLAVPLVFRHIGALA